MYQGDPLTEVNNNEFTNLQKLFHSEAKCEAFDINMIFYFHSNKPCNWPRSESEGFWNLEGSLIGSLCSFDVTSRG